MMVNYYVEQYTTHPCIVHVLLPVVNPAQHIAYALGYNPVKVMTDNSQKMFDFLKSNN
jgi:hypothetical protein